jgi:hypothetical protein
MNRATLHTWKSLTEDGDVRWLKYSFGPGTANTMAVRLEDGTWMVVSPPSGVPSSVIDDLAKSGTVTALVAPNAYHHRGQAEWRLRFPGAVSYAAHGALPRLAAKSSGVRYHPIADLIERALPRVNFCTPLGMKSPDMLIRVSVPGNTVWWMGDLFSNSSVEDQIWLLRLVAPLLGSGLGYRRNTKPGLVYVRDGAAWLNSIRNILANHPPSIVLPAHGNPVFDDAARRTSQLVGEL